VRLSLAWRSGGTLHRHVRDLPDEVHHRQPADGRRTAHEVQLVANGRVASVIVRAGAEHAAPELRAA
jgi:gamma-glutamyl-gamma-aminobutyrate hydrolase PuuD